MTLEPIKKERKKCVCVCVSFNRYCASNGVYIFVHACVQAKSSIQFHLFHFVFLYIFSNTHFTHTCVHNVKYGFQVGVYVSASDKRGEKWNERNFTNSIERNFFKRKKKIKHRPEMRAVWFLSASTDCQVPWAGSSWPIDRTTDNFFFFFVHNNQLKMFRNMGSTSQQCHHKYNVLSWVKIRCELMNLVCHANNSSLNQKKKMEKWKVFCQLISFYCCEHHRMFSADQLIKCSYLWHRLRSHYIRISFSTFFFSRSYPSRGTLCKNGKNYLQHKSFT